MAQPREPPPKHQGGDDDLGVEHRAGKLSVPERPDSLALRARPSPFYCVRNVCLVDPEFRQLAADGSGAARSRGDKHQAPILDLNGEVTWATKGVNDLLGQGKLVLTGQLCEHE